MRNTLLIAPLLFLVGCASMDQLGESVQWFFADTYKVKVSGTEKLEVERAFLKFSYQGDAQKPGEQVDRSNVQFILETGGLKFVPNETEAKSMVDVLLVADGPHFETKTHKVERPGKCFSGSKTCPPELVDETEYYWTCTYSLAVSAAVATSAVGGGNGVRLHTQWEVVTKDNYRLVSGQPLALVFINSLLTPPRKCNDAEKRLGGHLLALTYLLHQQPDVPQGDILVLERKGQYKIKVPTNTKYEEPQH